jgi:hypothetical protein
MSGPLPPPLPAVTLNYRTVVNGRTWYLYSLDYDTADGAFGTYFYAISDEHAEMIVEEIKATAKLRGQVIGSYRA